MKYADNTTSIDNTSVTWASSDVSVATVDNKGFVKAVGAGTTTIIITTDTQSANDQTIIKTATVVVCPLAKYDINDTVASSIIIPNAPSNFIVYTNATFASNITWEVYDSANNLIAPGDKSKIELLISSISGNIQINNAKAGTYKIYGFANSSYDETSPIKFLTINVIVPIRVEGGNIVMNVGNTYSIVNKSNIPNPEIFDYTYIGNSSIAEVNKTTGIITAKMKGDVTIRLTYNDVIKNPSLALPPIDLNISVIDGIALNSTEAIIYTSGTMLLNAVTTDPSQEIIWTSSDNSVASVLDGLVTGKKVGKVTITATQTINGVIKSATCTIFVQQSITKITINPSEVSLNIGDYLTLYATIEPIGLNNVKLNWVSSNENVVTITKAGDVTATIQDSAGGTAVISAINKDNVVVGSCFVIIKQKVTNITLSESSIVVPLSSKRIQLRAIVSPDNASNKKVTWSSTNNNMDMLRC